MVGHGGYDGPPGNNAAQALTPSSLATRPSGLTVGVVMQQKRRDC
jgi:hypothetical protein